MGGLWDAWSAWWSGQSVQAFDLWGLRILWWARVGKIMQFAAGLLIVLDIIGPKRLPLVAQRIERIRRGAITMLRTAGGNSDGEMRGIVIQVLVAIVFGAVFLVATLLDATALQAILVVIGVFLFVVLFQASLVIFTAVVIVPAIYLAAGLFRSLRWILDHGGPHHPVRWIGVGLFCLGFHFDLLAS